MNKLALAGAALIAATSLTSHAAEIGDDVHANDFHWMQLNLMHTIDQKPHDIDQGYKDTYLEFEFGGRSGYFDFYGYVDVFDITNSESSSKHETGGMFMKFAPRLSLDAVTGKDLSFGPVQELYIANLNNFGQQQQEHFIGLGADVALPWFGKVGMNLYSRYSVKNFGNEDEGSFNGFQFSANWFKPVYFFDNGSFISYQGYWDHMFAANGYSSQANRTTSGGQTYHGIYWHSDRFAAGYGLKSFYDTYGMRDGFAAYPGGSPLETTGFGHYFSITYKI
ncbi:nucleoside-specific channel-forming Tsx family protein [Agarivorans gilvus]|uniref:Outer membrane protein n=1 Tax=Agarivorans gilvus TaxID=680279 RepID=A0ABQ1HWK9_9ALTE|nr:outer membrane protein OmpK [Agarivorans gilvus]GGA94345.1 outer membrane protein [Agarivorans gilvus]